MEIMAATTNNHNQKELRLYGSNEQQQQQQHQTANSTATTLASGGARSPFQREVREWQRIDPDTGALLTGRLEADRWINGPLNKYGKKSSSSLSNSSNNSTTASQTNATTATAMATNTSSINAHKSTASKISLSAIVGNNNNNNSKNNNNMTTVTTPPSTPSPTLTTTMQMTTARPSWQQPSIYRPNNHNNSNNTPNYIQSHLMKSRVGDNNNCCGSSISRSSSGSSHSSSGDESRLYSTKTETDLRHHHYHHQYQHHRQSPTQHQQQQQQQQHRQQQIHFKQNDRLTPTHSPHSYHRVDLESFRHYNNNDNINSNNTNNNLNDTDDDGLRLSNRHLRRQQIPIETSTTSLQRSRSISIDDLSTDWDIQDGDSEEPAEWRRVSKLRRSFQSTTKTNQSFNSPTPSRRPLDLPTNSVSVSKIRAELENGRRLNTVMRNNHVDLAALSTILNGNGHKETKLPLTPKRSSFLTAESLKEIRGKLKKLSDESLYKEDFIINQQSNDINPEVEHIVDDQTKIKKSIDKSPERYRFTTKTEELSNKHTTNSLESRLKYKDTNATDWHNRRKSYGFEKMSPPDKATLRMDASTDSGLGRSGELQNWSPTSEALTNRTVVHFGESPKVNAVPVSQRRYRPQKSFEESENSPEEDTAVSKRHSIAVDESQYVRDNSRQTTQIRVNGFYEPGSFSKFMHSSESTTTNDRGQQKRVEFSKTEVHFATESGRVNIVETDSKPPPTNNFRRRRSRSSSVGPLQNLVKSATTVSTATSVSSASNASSIASSVAMPVTLFGDDNSKKKTIASTTVAYRASLVGSPEPKDAGINVTVTIPSHNESFTYTESSRSSYASTSGVDTTDCDTDEMTSLRGILKNKPAKPKPYVLGENIDKPDDLWGVQLKPISSGNGGSNPTKTERAFKSESPPLLSSLPQKSVAERIQELGTAATSSSQANSFSTKINVSLGNPTGANKNWEDTDLPKSNVMSIKLHSPQTAADEVPPPLKIVPPIAKPRTITNIKESQPPKLHTATTVKQAAHQTSLPTKDSLKIIKEARGARQLREHELSYFGVPVSTSEDEKLKSKYTSNSNFRNSPKRSLPLRKLSEENSISLEDEQREQWQLENHKPDLLKHNPIEMKPAERISLKKKAELDEEEEHLYENIANDITPIFKVKANTPLEQYDRKMDLKRDAMILSEMNKNADQTLKELSDEAALKDRRRRSLQRRNSKPLETIDEKSVAERINDTCIAVKISRGTYSSEAKKTSRHSTPSPTGVKGISSRERTSSQSSVECCPRARSRSLSSEKEYDNSKSKPSRTTQMVKHKSQKSSQSRSGSLESQRSVRSQYSSEEEQQQQQHRGGSFRREDRSRTKTKRITSSSSSAIRDKHRDDAVARLSSPQQQQHHYHHGDSKRLSSTTHSLAHREHVECKHDNATGSTTTARDQQRHRNHSSGLQRSSATSGSGRRPKDDIRDSQRMKRSSITASGRSTSERHEKHDTRSARNDDERNSPQRSSSHRVDRADKEKEKTSRSSKGHSSRSISQQHHERSTNSDKHQSTKDTKTKSAHTENTTYSKNAQHTHQSQHASKERHDRQHPQHKSKRHEDQAEHVHGLKSAIIKTTTKLRDKSRIKKDKQK